MDNVLRVFCGSRGRINISDYANYVLGKSSNIMEQDVITANGTIHLIHLADGECRSCHSNFYFGKNTIKLSMIEFKIMKKFL